MEFSRTGGAARRRVGIIVAVTGLAVLGTPVAARGRAGSAEARNQGAGRLSSSDQQVRLGLTHALSQPGALGAVAPGRTLSARDAAKLAKRAVNAAPTFTRDLERKVSASAPDAQTGATRILVGRGTQVKGPTGGAFVIPGAVVETLKALLPVYFAADPVNARGPAGRPGTGRKREVRQALKTHAAELAESAAISPIGF